MKSSNLTQKPSVAEYLGRGKNNHNIKIRNPFLLDGLILSVTLYFVCRNKTVTMIKN